MRIQFARWVKRIGLSVGLIDTAFMAYSYIGTDTLQKERLQAATGMLPATTALSDKLAYRLRGFHSLSRAEQACVNAAMELLSTNGVKELKACRRLAGSCFPYTSAWATSVRRDVDTSGQVALHVIIEIEVELLHRIYSFPSCLTLLLNGGDKIETVEHRWLSGPIVSHMTLTQVNIVGDFGDLWRRMQGYLLSSLSDLAMIPAPADMMQTPWFSASLLVSKGTKNSESPRDKALHAISDIFGVKSGDQASSKESCHIIPKYLLDLSEDALYDRQTGSLRGDPYGKRILEARDYLTQLARKEGQRNPKHRHFLEEDLDYNDNMFDLAANTALFRGDKVGKCHSLL